MDLPPPPPGLNIYQNAQPALLFGMIFSWALALVAVVLRFTARGIKKAGFWWDDYLMLPAIMLSTCATFISQSMVIGNGVGKHIWVAHPTHLQTIAILKGIFIEKSLYIFEIVIIKLSILCFYYRIFEVPRVHYVIFALAFVVLGWGIGLIFATFFQCVPLNYVWNQTLGGPHHCGVNDSKYGYGTAIPNTITDVMILILPMPLVWNLHVSNSRKFLLSSVFLLGSFVVVISIVRIVWFVRLDLKSPDFTWTYRNSHVWSIIELNVAVISGCLPSLRPILVYVATHSSLNSLQSLFHRSRSSRTSTDKQFSGGSPWANTKNTVSISHYGSKPEAPQGNGNNRWFTRLPDDSDSVPLRTEQSKPDVTNAKPIEMQDRDGIAVQNDVDVHWQNADQV